LETAAALGQPVMIYVTADGAVGFDAASSITDGPNGDRGTGSAAYIIAYNPNGRPNVKTDSVGYQLGDFTASGQSSDDQTLVGTPDKAAMAVFANYLQFAGQLPLLEKVLPGQFSSAQLDYILRLA